MRKAVYMLLSLFVVVSVLSGCGTGSTTAPAANESTSAGQSAPTQASAPEEAPTQASAPEAAPTGEKATLTILHYLMEKPKLKGLDKLVAAFKEQNPNVEVEVQGTSLDQYGNILKLKVASGEIPDIIFGNPKTYSEIVEAGHIKDLTGTPAVANIEPQFLESTSIDGKVYGVPLSLGSGGVFYNKVLFKQAGVEVPKTWSEFVKVMEALDDKGITPFAAGYKDLGTFGGVVYVDIFGGPSAKMPNWRQEVMDGTRKFADLPEFKGL